MRKLHQHHLRGSRRPDNVTPIVTHGGAGLQLAPGVSLPEQVSVALQEVALNARSGLLAFAVGVGLEVFHTLLEENVSELVGQKGRHQPERQAYRHGHEPSSLTLGGRKVVVDKPRVRSCQGEEVVLPLWKAFSEQDIAGTMVRNACWPGSRRGSTRSAWNRSVSWTAAGPPQRPCLGSSSLGPSAL